MANPNPEPHPENLRPFPKGISGNPAGYSNKRRYTDRLLKLIEKGQLDDTVALVWLGAMLGDEKILNGRKPNFAFFKEFLERVEGPAEAVATESQRDGEQPKRIVIPRVDERLTPRED